MVAKYFESKCFGDAFDNGDVVVVVQVALDRICLV